MPHLKSSHLKHVEHDPKTNVLTVQFSDGSVYNYSNVNKQKYEGLLKAPSASHYLSEHVKGLHKFKRVF